MWKLDELSHYLDGETLLRVSYGQFDEMRHICYLLSGRYDIEFRNRRFTSNDDKALPITITTPGEPFIISCKKYPTDEEFERSLIGKSETFIHNQKKAYDRGVRCFYDNKANAIFARLLKSTGHIEASRDAIVLHSFSVSELASIFQSVLEKSLNDNFPERDEMALKLIVKEPEFIFFASVKAMRNVQYCYDALHINSDIPKHALSPDVLSSWRFVNMLVESPLELDPDAFPFPHKIKRVITNSLSETSQPDLLKHVSAYHARHEKTID